MADAIKEFPAKGRKSRYSEEWFDGRIWRINWREEMRCKSIGAARSSVFFMANKRGLKLKTQKDGDDHIVIQAVRKTDGT